MNGKVCSNDQRFRREIMEDQLLTAIKLELLSDAGIERFRAKLLRRLLCPAVDAARVKSLETEVANITDVIAKGIHSPALLAPLQVAEGELERLRVAAEVIDLKAIIAALPGAVARYRELVADFGSKTPVDIEQARELIRSITDRIAVRPGQNGVPVAELALNQQIAFAAIGGVDNQIDLVTGARYSNIRVPLTPELSGIYERAWALFAIISLRGHGTLQVNTRRTKCLDGLRL